MAAFLKVTVAMLVGIGFFATMLVHRHGWAAYRRPDRDLVTLVLEGIGAAAIPAGLALMVALPTRLLARSDTALGVWLVTYGLALIGCGLVSISVERAPDTVPEVALRVADAGAAAR
jgi:hypothetical protein